MVEFIDSCIQLLKVWVLDAPHGRLKDEGLLDLLTM